MLSMFRLLADGVVILHLTFVLFVVFGGLLTFWWPRISWVHLPAAAWGAAVEFGGWVCPLTPLEHWLRLEAGQSAYPSDFIEHYVLPVLYPAMLTRDRHGPPLRFQLLVYPGVAVTEDQASVLENGDGYLLTRADIEWFTAQYLGGDGALDDPRFDPVYADLTGVAPAHVITAEYDPLRDGGHAYAERLRAGGVPVTERCYHGHIHGCFGMQAVVDASRDIIADAGAILRHALERTPSPVTAS